MLNYGNYILHIVALILLVSVVRHSAYMERKRNFKYNLTVLCVCFALAGYILRDYSTTYHLYFLAVIAAYFVLLATILYFIFLIGSIVPSNTILMRILNITGGIILLMILVSPYTKWIFSITKDCAFERGSLVGLGIIWMIIAFIITIIVNIKKYKDCEAEDIIRLVALFALELFAIIIQVFQQETFQEGYIGSALMLMLYYAFVIEIDSKYDQMTTVFSRTYFKRYVERINRKGNFVLIMFDVNGLKRTNDTYGHAKGDELIISVADGIKQAVGNDGKVFRLGGDEFMVVLKINDEAAGTEIVNKATENFKQKSENIGINVTASYGISLCIKNENFDDAMLRVDKKMYECKQLHYQQEGNNRRR